MELITAARKKLLTVPAVTGYVQDRVWKERLEEVIENTGRRAIVLKDQGGWAQPDRVQTDEHPLLKIECWADHTRDNNGTIVSANGSENAKAVYRVVNAALHALEYEVWGGPGGLPIMECARWAEPVHETPHEPTDRAQCWSVLYAVRTVHGAWV